MRMASGGFMGTKFFCSATHADYAMVTAKPRAGRGSPFRSTLLAAGDKEKEIRNGYYHRPHQVEDGHQ
jgi:hypothetical protein